MLKTEIKTGYSGRFFPLSWNLHVLSLVLLSPTLTAFFLFYVLSLLNPLLKPFNREITLEIKRYNVTYVASAKPAAPPQKPHPEKLTYYPPDKKKLNDLKDGPCDLDQGNFVPTIQFVGEGGWEVHVAAVQKEKSRNYRKSRNCDEKLKLDPWDPLAHHSTILVGRYGSY